MEKCNFDKYASDYREIHDKSMKLTGANSDYFSEYKIIELIKHEKKLSKINILDFGCGDGNSLFYLREYFPNAYLTGVDISEKCLIKAINKGISNSRFVSFNGHTLPFNNNEFDVIFASMVFHHIDFDLHEKIMCEIKRVLNKDGRFYNFEHNPFNPITRKIVCNCEFDSDAKLLKPSYSKYLISNSGLKLQKLTYTMFLPRYRIFKFLYGFEKMLTWLPLGAQYYIKAIK